MDLQFGASLPIAQLCPSIDPNKHYVRGVVTLVWPYSSSTQSTSILLVEPDFRLRRKHGQVRITFRGASAKAVAKAGISSGNELTLNLLGAQYLRDLTVASTPGRGVEWELQFGPRLLVQIMKATGESSLLNVDSSSPSPALSPIALSPPPSPVFHHAGGPFQTPLLSKKDLTWSSPAFLKRKTVQNIPIISTRHESIVDDDFGEPAPKRTKFGRGSGQWRLSDRTPSPEKQDSIITSEHLERHMHQPLGTDVPERISNPGDQDGIRGLVLSEAIEKLPIVDDLSKSINEGLSERISVGSHDVPEFAEQFSEQMPSPGEQHERRKSDQLEHTVHLPLEINPSDRNLESNDQEKGHGTTGTEEVAQTFVEDPNIDNILELIAEELSIEISAGSSSIPPILDGLSTHSEFDPGLPLPLRETFQEPSVVVPVDKEPPNDTQTGLRLAPPVTEEAAGHSPNNDQPSEFINRAFTTVSDRSESIDGSPNPEQPRLRPLLSAGLPLISPLLQRNSERSYFLPHEVLVEGHELEISTGEAPIVGYDHWPEEGSLVNICTEVEEPVHPKVVNQRDQDVPEAIKLSNAPTISYDDPAVNITRPSDRNLFSQIEEGSTVTEQTKSSIKAQYVSGSEDARIDDHMEMGSSEIPGGDGSEKEELSEDNYEGAPEGNLESCNGFEHEDSGDEYYSQVDDTFEGGQVDPHRFVDVNSIHSDDIESVDLIDSQRFEPAIDTIIPREHLLEPPEQDEEDREQSNMLHSNNGLDHQHKDNIDVTSSVGMVSEVEIPTQLGIQEKLYIPFTPEASGVSRPDVEMSPEEIGVEPKSDAADSFARSQDSQTGTLKPLFLGSSEPDNFDGQFQLPTPLATQPLQQLEVDDGESLDENGRTEEEEGDNESPPSIKAIINRYDYDQENHIDDDVSFLKTSFLSGDEEDVSQLSSRSLFGPDERDPGVLAPSQEAESIIGIGSEMQTSSPPPQSSSANEYSPQSSPLQMSSAQISVPQTLSVETPSTRVTAEEHDIPTNGFRTPFSYFASLAAFQKQFNSIVDTFAVVVSASQLARAKKGPRDFYETIYITDPSITTSESENSIYVTQIFRPNKVALPLVQTGDVLLLRDFKIQTQKHKPLLLSTNSSSWVVFSGENEEQIRGPPVEFGDEERSHAQGLRKWWQSLQEEHRTELINSLRSSTPLSKAKGKGNAKRTTGGRNSDVVHELRDGTKYTDNQSDGMRSTPASKAKGKGKARRSTGGRISDVVHELRDGTKYTDNRPDGMESLHELRDGTTYTNDGD